MPFLRSASSQLLLSFLVATLICGPVAFAEPTSRPASRPTSQPALRTLPKGDRLQLPERTLQTYTLEEMKVILHIYADYRMWGKQLPRLKLQVDNYSELTLNQSKQLKLQAEMIQVLRTERKFLTEKWTEENRLRHLCENKPSFGLWIAWGSAAVATIVATVLGIVIATQGE